MRVGGMLTATLFTDAFHCLTQLVRTQLTRSAGEGESMRVDVETDLTTTVAARVAGEDIASGDFVAVMHEVVEFPSFMWNCSTVSLSPDEPVRIRFFAEGAGKPYKVIGVCLPFVYTKNCRGRVVIIDTRKQQLVRLDRDCAQAVWSRIKGHTSKSGK